MFDLWCQLKRGLKNNTFENYKYMYNTFVRPNFGKLRLSTLRKSDVKRFYNSLADDLNLKASIIDNIHTVLHQVLDMAVDDNDIRTNPSDNVLKELKQSHVLAWSDHAGAGAAAYVSKEQSDVFTLVSDFRRHDWHRLACR